MKFCNFCAGVPAKIRKKFQEKYFKAIFLREYQKDK